MNEIHIIGIACLYHISILWFFKRHMFSGKLGERGRATARKNERKRKIERERESERKKVSVRERERASDRASERKIGAEGATKRCRNEFSRIHIPKTHNCSHPWM